MNTDLKTAGDSATWPTVPGTVAGIGGDHAIPVGPRQPRHLGRQVGQGAGEGHVVFLREWTRVANGVFSDRDWLASYLQARQVEGDAKESAVPLVDQVSGCRQVARVSAGLDERLQGAGPKRERGDAGVAAFENGEEDGVSAWHVPAATCTVSNRRGRSASPALRGDPPSRAPARYPRSPRPGRTRSALSAFQLIPPSSPSWTVRTGTGGPPERLIRCSPWRSLTNAIEAPSGEKQGYKACSVPGSGVMAQAWMPLHGQPPPGARNTIRTSVRGDGDHRRWRQTRASKRQAEPLDGQGLLPRRRDCAPQAYASSHAGQEGGGRKSKRELPRRSVTETAVGFGRAAEPVAICWRTSELLGDVGRAPPPLVRVLCQAVPHEVFENGRRLRRE